MTSSRTTAAGWSLSTAAAVVMVVLPALLVLLGAAAGAVGTQPGTDSVVSAAPVGGGQRTASLADTVRFEAGSPAPLAGSLEAPSIVFARLDAAPAAPGGAVPFLADASRRL